MNYEMVGKVPFSNVAKTLLEVVEGGDYTVDLDAVDYRRFIHIRADLIEKKFVGDEIVRTDTYYDLERCLEEDFQSNEFHKKYFDMFKDRF